MLFHARLNLEKKTFPAHGRPNSNELGKVGKLFPHRQFVAVVLMTWFLLSFQVNQKKKSTTAKKKTKKQQKVSSNETCLPAEWLRMSGRLMKSKASRFKLQERGLERLRDKFSLAGMLHVVKTIRRGNGKRCSLETLPKLKRPPFYEWTFLSGQFCFWSMFARGEKVCGKASRSSWRYFASFTLLLKAAVRKVH